MFDKPSFDLDETEFAFFSEVHVARARDGLAARVAEAGLTDVQVRAGHGSSTADWDNLAAWFRGRPGTPSRVSTLGRDAVNAVRTLLPPYHCRLLVR